MSSPVTNPNPQPPAEQGQNKAPVTNVSPVTQPPQPQAAQPEPPVQVVANPPKKTTPVFSYKEVPTNFPQYRHTGQCLLCPFETKQSTKIGVEDTLKKHVVSQHNVEL